MLETKRSQMQKYFTIQEQITPVVPVQLKLDINILPKFGADWSIFIVQMIECKQRQI